MSLVEEEFQFELYKEALEELEFTSQVAWQFGDIFQILCCLVKPLKA